MANPEHRRNASSKNVTLRVTLHQEKMLPRNLPKHGNFLVNPATKFGGIELNIAMGELRFGLLEKYLCIQGPAGKVS